MRISYIPNVIAQDNRFLFTSVAILSLVLAGVNFSMKSPILGAVIAPLYLLINTVFIGQVFFSDQSKPFQIFYGFLTFFAFLTIVGTLIYWVRDFSNSSVLATLLIITLISSSLNRIRRFQLVISDTYSKIINEKVEGKGKIWSLGMERMTVQIMYLFLIGVSIFLLFSSRTGESLMSIWDTVSPSFPIFFFLSTFILFYMILYFKPRPIYTLINISLLVFVVPLIHILVLKYPVYYAVVNHIANQRLLSQFGEFIQAPGLEPMASSVLPKALNFIGFYTSYVALSKILSLEILWIQVFTPIFFSIYVPATYYLILRIVGLAKREALFVSACLLFTQFNVFIMVPPYKPAALALVFLLASIFFWIRSVKQSRTLWRNVMLGLILTVATGLIHPHVGMYALISSLVSIYLLVVNPFAQKNSARYRFISQAGLFLMITVLGGSLLLLYTIQGLLMPFYEFRVMEANILDWLRIVFPPIWSERGLNFSEQLFYGYLNNFRYIYFFLLYLGIKEYLKRKLSVELLVMVTALVYISFASMIIQIIYFPGFEPQLAAFRFELYMNFISYPVVGLGILSLLSKLNRFTSGEDTDFVYS